MAARRVFLLRALFLRDVSTWRRKSPTSSASRSSTRSLVGLLPRFSPAKRRNNRKVSRYPAIVFGLASIWLRRRSVKNCWRSSGKVDGFILAPSPLRNRLPSGRQVPAIRVLPRYTSRYAPDSNDQDRLSACASLGTGLFPCDTNR